MRGSTTGQLFAVHTFGESHGPAVGAVIEGVPPGFKLDLAAVQQQLDRRRPGQNAWVSQRDEEDRVEVLSGLDRDSRALGTPLTLVIRSTDARPRDYDSFRAALRPSHADWTWTVRTGLPPQPGGGRSSARETAARVAAGAVAGAILAERFGARIVAWVDQIGSIVAPPIDEHAVRAADVDQSPVRCPHPESSDLMVAELEAARAAGDSVGGAIRCVVHGAAPGWGEPVFDKCEALLAAAALSLPACRAFEVGSGFGAAAMRGSAHNDLFLPGDPRALQTATNHSGGIQGGLCNGMPIRMRLGFKPAATIAVEQPTVDLQGASTSVRGKGRHDPCVVPRAVPIVEASVALVLLDLALRAAADRIPAP